MTQKAESSKLNPTPALFKIPFSKISNFTQMQSQLLYISIVEQNLERYEAKVKSEGTVSEKLSEYIARKKNEIVQMKNRLLDKTNYTQANLF